MIIVNIVSLFVLVEGFLLALSNASTLKKHPAKLTKLKSLFKIKPITFPPNPIKKSLMNINRVTKSRSDVNEFVLELEKMNPTPNPAQSPLINGVWEIVYTGVSDPTLLIYQAVKMIPNSIIEASQITLTISPLHPRIEASSAIRIGRLKTNVTVIAELESLSGVRLKETYESGKVGRMKIPVRRSILNRELSLSYLDEDLLIVRDFVGSPEVLRRVSGPEDTFINNENVMLSNHDESNDNDDNGDDDDAVSKSSPMSKNLKHVQEVNMMKQKLDAMTKQRALKADDISRLASAVSKESSQSSVMNALKKVDNRETEWSRSLNDGRLKTMDARTKSDFPKAVIDPILGETATSNIAVRKTISQSDSVAVNHVSSDHPRDASAFLRSVTSESTSTPAAIKQTTTQTTAAEASANRNIPKYGNVVYSVNPVTAERVAPNDSKTAVNEELKLIYATTLPRTPPKGSILSNLYIEPNSPLPFTKDPVLLQPIELTESKLPDTDFWDLNIRLALRLPSRKSVERIIRLAVMATVCAVLTKVFMVNYIDFRFLVNRIMSHVVQSTLSFC